MRRFLGLCCVLLLLAGSASAEELTQERAVQMLAQENTPADQARLVSWFADSTHPLPLEPFRDALLNNGSWPVMVQAARIAQFRGDPAHAPALFRLFLRSKAVQLPHDPDLFERALRTLQVMPEDAVRAAIVAAASEDGGGMAGQQLSDHWLGPLAQVDTSSAAGTDPVLRATLDAHFQEWLLWLVDQGPAGLVALQSDSGDGAFELFRELEVDTLAWLVLAGSEPEREAAVETCRQRGIGAADLRLGASRLADAGMPMDAAAERRLDEAQSTLSRRQSLGRRWVAPRARPAAPPQVAPFASSPLATPAARSSGRWLFPLCVLAVLGLLLAAARRESMRPWVFRLGAIMLAPAALIAVELVLAIVGYQPANAVRPTFNPTRAPQTLLMPSDLGEGWSRSGYDHLRMNVFHTPRPEGVLRIAAVGASMVHGSNYLFEEAWPAFLAGRVQEAYPDRRVEILNFGLGGATSDEVYFYAREILEHDLDLLVVSCGFNDFVQLGRLAKFRAFSPQQMRLRLTLDRLRLARLIGEMRPDIGVLQPDPEGAHLDDEAPGEQEVATLRRIASSSLEGNLRRIAWLARSEGVPVLFVAQAQNEDACGDGSAAGAVDAPEQDCFPVEAREAVLRAGGLTGVPVVDAAAALRERSVDDTVDSRWFQDVIHLTREGNAVLGEAAAPEAIRLLR